MLYYSGFTRRIGGNSSLILLAWPLLSIAISNGLLRVEVDEGSTVMDYLPAERARGITITSAAITFSWTPSTPGSSPHTINLIDTPGHADFTFEVERSIRVLDGAVTILDGVAGVEAQTEKVWRQAERYNIPRIVFVNKLDRVGARFGPTVKEIAAKLNGWPAVCQLPIYETDGKGGEDIFRGVVDIVDQRVFMWSLGDDGQKIDLHDYAWLKQNKSDLHAEALTARTALVELLSEHDEDLVEVFLELGDHHLIPPAELKKSLRKATLKGDGRIIPVLCGASFRNVGVQPLLDAIIDFLPSPLDRPPTSVSYNHGKQKALLEVTDTKVCALAFKVVNDPKRGAMVYVRVYSGTLTRTHHLYNTNLGEKERVHRLLRMYADDAIDINAIPTGHIGVIIGLKHARTGDTLVSESPSAHKQKHHTKHHPTHSTETLQLRPIDVPPPVFFASIEPLSLSEQKPLEEALAMLLREDPSLHVSVDEDSGQTLISGMGELHLEIARDRLVGDLKAKAEMGRILISYRETVPPGPAGEYVRRVFDKEVSGKRAAAACAVSVEALDVVPGDATVEGNIVDVVFDYVQTTDTESGNVVEAKMPKWVDEVALQEALTGGAAAALGRGPALGFPVRGARVRVKVDLGSDVFGQESTLAAFSAAARMATMAALKEAVGGECVLMEPVMDVVVTCDEKHMGQVVADISGARGGHVMELGGLEVEAAEGSEIELAKVYAPGVKAGVAGARDEGSRKRTVRARVPLKEMVGYLKHLRAITAGRGTFVMALEGWEKMNGNRVRDVVQEVRGG